MGGLVKKVRKFLGLKRSRDRLPKTVMVGRHTYGVHRNMIAGASADAPVTFGSFCSIGPDVTVFAKVDHPINLVSTYPFKTMMLHPEQGNQDAVTKGGITIGHDVWIGARAMVMSGVTIGHGAIVGAGAVVAKDVPPYAVVVGNPGRIIRHRFDEDTIEQLLKLCWWDWPDEKIEEHEELFYGPIEDFLAKAK